MFCLNGEPIPKDYLKPAELLNSVIDKARLAFSEAYLSNPIPTTALIYEHDDGTVEVVAAPIEMMLEGMLKTGCEDMAKELRKMPPGGMVHSIVMMNDSSVTLIEFELISSVPSNPSLN